MKLIADFHVHSRFSRATARDLSLENLYTACRIKGVHILGTGDFTHPEWFAEIEAKLEAAEPGLFRLRKEPSKRDLRLPAACGPMRFVLTSEVSTIYKKDGRTRKNHNLVFVPDLETARKFNKRIGSIGNIASDGRPILGLDARDLLEIVLECAPAAFLVPAHIWTPWFSMLGSKSGFDSLHGCFGDLSGHIFAAETGLSSDPAMNRRVSSLDALCLISNSDAHSAANIGREATVFDTDLSFFALRAAMEAKDPQRLRGTIEFFPEQGKYHWDGHRACGIGFEPAQTKRAAGVCPACGGPLTVGVLSRLEELADRPEEDAAGSSAPYRSLIPLTDILAEILQTGSRSAKVKGAFRNTIERLGPELHILMECAPDMIADAGIPLLGEAIRRMREKRIRIRPGFDGQYGSIRIFSREERTRLQGRRALFSVFRETPKTPPAAALEPEATREPGRGNPVKLYPY
jgi:DNA helicase II / ATP-dependent DNA helicase PcrA